MLFSRELRAAERSLDGYSLRFEAAMHNMANINTPGYKRHTVDFGDALKDVLAMSEDHIDPDRPMDGQIPDSSHFLESWQPHISTAQDGKAIRVDGNGVSIEQEVAYASRASGGYSRMATWIAAEYRTLKTIVQAR